MGDTILYYTILYYTILYYTILYYTILYYTILYYTILYYTILYYTIPYHTIPYHTILYYTILYYTILYYTILYYTILYYTILYYTILYYTILYYTILYYTILYYTILYYTILYYTILYYTMVCFLRRSLVPACHGPNLQMTPSIPKHASAVSPLTIAIPQSPSTPNLRVSIIIKTCKFIHGLSLGSLWGPCPLGLPEIITITTSPTYRPEKPRWKWGPVQKPYIPYIYICI